MRLGPDEPPLDGRPGDDRDRLGEELGDDDVGVLLVVEAGEDVDRRGCRRDRWTRRRRRRRRPPGAPPPPRPARASGPDHPSRFCARLPPAVEWSDPSQPTVACHQPFMQAARSTRGASMAETTYQSQTVRLGQFEIREDQMIEGITATDCLILGPAGRRPPRLHARPLQLGAPRHRHRQHPVAVPQGTRGRRLPGAGQLHVRPLQLPRRRHRRHPRDARRLAPPAGPRVPAPRRRRPSPATKATTTTDRSRSGFAPATARPKAASVAGADRGPRATPGEVRRGPPPSDQSMGRRAKSSAFCCSKSS